MKNLKFITSLFLTALLTLTSCQDEIDSENGQNPNTNNSESQTASNLERTSMYDGSFDDFLDGTSCSSILLPVVATVNGQQVSIISQSDYQLVLNILGQFTNDNDTVTLQFPLSVRLSNYTEVIVANQGEYDAIIDACETAENTGKDAISCLDIDFPITILTYSLNLEQTGSLVIQSEQQLYAYMNNMGNTELFSVKYPITATLSNNSTVTLTSDLDLQASIEDCLDTEDAEEEAEEEAKNLETILVNGAFKVQTFINAGVNKASDYANYTIDFANDKTCTAIHSTLSAVQGTYNVTSETEVYLNLTFAGNATFNLLNNKWEVTSFSNTSISLKSTANAAITLVLTQI
ncbi:hypothetical protein ACFSKN_12430 [Mariniflexile gromovii]|uniref:DUF1735 domain-containing protein n=1 Tax=Mariniflexile gromovii TaxID=362523 RepID=A0ABS4BWG7_9FLAO|nr:hypothetical protein [Mariniflexile gromovii]MBP0904405.1 hypothetical protein [Mariniflexile gromovii]